MPSCTLAAPHGSEWAASVLQPLHQLLAARRPQVTSALAAAFDDAVQLLPDEVRQHKRSACHAHRLS